MPPIHALTTTPPATVADNMAVGDVPLVGSIPLLETGTDLYSPSSGCKTEFVQPGVATGGEQATHTEYISGGFIFNETAKGAYVCVDITGTSGNDVVLQCLWSFQFYDGAAGVYLINDIWPAEEIVPPTKRLYLLYPGAGDAFYDNPAVRDLPTNPRLIVAPVPLPKTSAFSVVKNGGVSWSGNIRVTYLP